MHFKSHLSSCVFKGVKNNRRKYEKHSKFKQSQNVTADAKQNQCRCQEMAFANTTDEDERAAVRWATNDLEYNSERLIYSEQNSESATTNNLQIENFPMNATNTNHDRRQVSRESYPFNLDELTTIQHARTTSSPIFNYFSWTKSNHFKRNNYNNKHGRSNTRRVVIHSFVYYMSCLWIYLSLMMFSCASASDLDKSDRFLDKINEQSIAAVFNKVAYGSTTKRSIPDNAYLYTTLATPLLTTYKYSDGNQEWYRVDVKEPEILTDEKPSDMSEDNQGMRDNDNMNAGSDFGNLGSSRNDRTNNDRDSYGIDLEKDHGLPTSAPAADILKNNNNKHYNNPNRYNNDRLRPEQQVPPLAGNNNKPSGAGAAAAAGSVESVTERDFPRTSTGYSVLRNVRPTKSMFGKDIPSYVPPSRSFFTPPLPPEYLNPFADKPTLRGTNSDTYQNRRPIPPPSLMPKKDRIPFRPDLPPSVSDSNTRPDFGGSNSERTLTNFAPPSSNSQNNPSGTSNNDQQQNSRNSEQQRKKTLNTPSQNVHLDRLGDFYGLNRLHNESNFEYEPMVLIPSISRILSGSNGRKEDLPDILLRTVTATPNHNRNLPHGYESANRQKTRHDVAAPPQPANIGPLAENPNRQETIDEISLNNQNVNQQAIASPSVPKNSDASAINNGQTTATNNNRNIHGNNFNKNSNRNTDNEPENKQFDTTTIISDILNLPNVKVKQRPEVLNTTRAASGHEIWSISWNVHIYLVVFLYVLLAIFSIVKLVRYERENHMFSKSYFLAVHLLLTTICVLRIFYLAYDPYNINNSFGIFTYDILHNLPLSLLATTFAILIVFLLKRTLTHLKVKTRPVFLVLFSMGHMFLCFCLNLAESFGLFGRESFLSLVCRFVYILLCWSLGLSYIYLYKIIKNVLAKKSQNLSEMCSQNISYASHITIAVALLFTLLGFVELYGLFFIKTDRFSIPQHWILWGWELSIRLLEISIITLLAIVVSLRMSQREKTNVGFPLFPCTTSDSSSDNYPNNCNTNLNALNYSLRSTQTQYRSQLSQNQLQLQQQHNIAAAQTGQDLNSLDNIPTDIVERPNLLDKKSTVEQNFPPIITNPAAERNNASSDLSDNEHAASNFERFERPNWQGSQRFGHHDVNFERDNFPVRNFERINDEINHSNLGSLRSEPQFDARGGSGRFSNSNHNFNDGQQPSIHGGGSSSNHSNHSGSGSARSSLKPYEKCRYYAKPKYDDMYNSSSGGNDDDNPKLLKRDAQIIRDDDSNNLYSEPLDISGGTSSNNTDRSSEYDRRYQELDRQDLERRSRSSWTNSGRRSTGRNRKSDRERSGRGHQAGIHTLPNQDTNASMLVDERGFLRFRHLGEEENMSSMSNINMGSKSRKHRYHQNDLNHYSDA